MTDQLWSDSTGLLLVKFVLRLVEEHHVSSVETKKYCSDYCRGEYNVVVGIS